MGILWWTIFCGPLARNSLTAWLFYYAYGFYKSESFQCVVYWSRSMSRDWSIPIAMIWGSDSTSNKLSCLNLNSDMKEKLKAARAITLCPRHKNPLSLLKTPIYITTTFNFFREMPVLTLNQAPILPIKYQHQVLSKAAGYFEKGHCTQRTSRHFEKAFVNFWSRINLISVDWLYKQGSRGSYQNQILQTHADSCIYYLIGAL